MAGVVAKVGIESRLGPMGSGYEVTSLGGKADATP
jgi:hypothetical protein